MESITTILEGVPGVDRIETFLPTADKPVIPHTWWSSASSSTGERMSGSCYYRDGKVIYCSVITANLELKHVIELRGDPEAVAFVEEWADSRMLTYYILYLQQGLVAVHSDFNWRSGEAIEFKPTMRIGGFYVFHPDSYEELVGGPDYYMVGPFYSEIEQTQRPWSGYGIYEYDVP